LCLFLGLSTRQAWYTLECRKASKNVSNIYDDADPSFMPDPDGQLTMNKLAQHSNTRTTSGNLIPTLKSPTSYQRLAGEQNRESLRASPFNQEPLAPESTAFPQARSTGDTQYTIRSPTSRITDNQWREALDAEGARTEQQQWPEARPTGASIQNA
jgi:hypothetical protein